jgi:tetratricopeptide (TPR) repeat protein
MEQSDFYRRGIIFAHRGNLGEAKRCFEEALAAARRGAATELLMAVLIHLANVYAALGEREKAVPLYQEVLSIQRTKNDEEVDQRAVGLTLVNLGNLCRENGEADRARAYYLEGSDLIHQAADDLSLGILYSNFGLLEEASGRIDEAIVFFQRAIALHKKTGHEEGLAATWGQLGRTFVKIGKDKEGEVCFNHASTHFNRLGDPAGEAEALRALSHLYQKRGDPELALHCLVSVLEIHRRTGWPVPREDETRISALRQARKEGPPKAEAPPPTGDPIFRPILEPTLKPTSKEPE